VIWQVTLRSCEVEFHYQLCIHYFYLYLLKARKYMQDNIPESQHIAGDFSVRVVEAAATDSSPLTVMIDF